MNITTSKECRYLYREILQGYTYLDDEDLYVKHFTEGDLGHLEVLYKKCEKKILKIGLESTKDKLKFLKEEGYWTEDEENEYMSARWAIEDGYKFKGNLEFEEQKQNFQKVIEEKERIFETINSERRELLGPTTESFCDKKINEQYVRLALFKDRELKEPLFTEEEFENISYIDLSKLVQKYNEAVNKFTEMNTERIAVNGFFLNAFIMSDNDPVKFFGKSVLDLTMYQMSLYSKGKFFKSVLEEGKDPPESLYNSIEEKGVEPIVNWFNTAHQQIKNERKRKEMLAKSNAARRR